MQVRVNQNGGHALPIETQELIKAIYQLKNKINEKQDH
jgi:hypothetical protein